MDKKLIQLETILHQQIATHERLTALLEEKLAAFRKADRRRIDDCTRLANAQVQQVAELEKQRLVLAAELTQILDPTAAQPWRLGELAQRLPEPVRGRLLVLRHQLRQRMEHVRQRSAVARHASELLVRHMQGMLQTIAAAVTGVGVYSRAGGLTRAATAISTFNATA